MIRGLSCTARFIENRVKWSGEYVFNEIVLGRLSGWIVHIILAFLALGSISCCRVSVEDRTRQLYSFVPFAESRTCWVYGRSRYSARPHVACRRRHLNHSCDVVRARSQRDVDASAPSATAARREISVYPSADLPAASSASSEKNKDRSLRQIMHHSHTLSIIIIYY